MKIQWPASILWGTIIGTCAGVITYHVLRPPVYNAPSDPVVVVTPHVVVPAPIVKPITRSKPKKVSQYGPDVRYVNGIPTDCSEVPKIAHDYPPAAVRAAALNAGLTKAQVDELMVCIK